MSTLQPSDARVTATSDPASQDPGRRPTAEELLAAVDVAVRTACVRFPRNMLRDLDDVAGEVALFLVQKMSDSDWRLPSKCALTTYTTNQVHWSVLKRIRTSLRVSNSRVAVDIEDVPAPAPTASRWDDEDWRERVMSALNEAIRQLPPRARRLFRRRYLDGATYKELREEFGLEGGALRTALHRARQAISRHQPLRELLVQFDPI